MTKTEQNLQEAFAGESQANRKYLAFAKAAIPTKTRRLTHVLSAARNRRHFSGWIKRRCLLIVVSCMLLKKENKKPAVTSPAFCF